MPSSKRRDRYVDRGPGDDIGAHIDDLVVIRGNREDQQENSNDGDQRPVLRSR